MLMNLNLEGYEAEKEGKTDLLPAGDYTAKIVEAEAKQTKSGQGHMLVLLFEVVDGECKGKRFMDNLNVVHANQEAQRIALQRLKGILEKGGHKNPNFLGDSQELIGLTVGVRLEQQTYGENNDKVSNNVKGYKAVGSVSQGGTAVAPAAVAAPAAAAAPVAPPPAANAPAAPGAFPWGQPQ